MKINSFWRVLIKLVGLFCPDGPTGDRFRGRLYQPFLKRYGTNFKVASGAFIFNPSGLSVGDNVYIGFGSYLGQGEITIEDEVLIGNFVSITASNHLKVDGSYRFGGFEGKAVFIGRGSWLAAGCKIMAGVEVGAGALIGAGAVVTKTVNPHSIALGIPAKEIAK